MDDTILLTKDDMNDIYNGAGFFASGGGGALKDTRKMIDIIWEKEELPDVHLIDAKYVPNNANLCSVEMVGSPSDFKEYGQYGAVKAIDYLSKKAGKNIEYLVAIETGAVNITLPMMAIAKQEKGKKLIMVDCTGSARSVPHLQDTTYAVGNISEVPAVFANDIKKDDENSVEVFIETNGKIAVDTVARGIVADKSFENVAGSANFVMTGAEMKKYGSLGCVTMAQELGRQLREAKTKKIGVFQIIKKFLYDYKDLKRETRLLGKGTITKIETVSAKGFDSLKVTIKTDNDILEVLALNENLLVWSNKKGYPITMAPDLISYVDEDYNVYSNADIKKGQKIMLIGTQATKLMRSEKILNDFLVMLKNMGYYGSYVPIEEIPHSHQAKKLNR